MEVYTEGLSDYRARQPHDQSPGGCTGWGVCVWGRDSLHVRIVLQQWALDQWMCAFTKEYMKGLQLCYLIATTFPASLHLQWSWTIYPCCGEINLDPWIGGWGWGWGGGERERKENSIRLRTISGTGIQISWGIRECVPIAKCLCAGKDNRDFSTIKQLIRAVEFSCDKHINSHKLGFQHKLVVLGGWVTVREGGI